MNNELSLNHSKILIIDDEPEILELLSGILTAKGCNVRTVTDGLKTLNETTDFLPDLILLDVDMPVINGFEICAFLKRTSHLKDIPVIFVSGMSNVEDKMKGFQCGGVDYITKPFNLEEVEVRVDTHLKLRSYHRELEVINKKLEQKVQSQVREITELQMATIFALSKLAESRDDYTGRHLERVQGYCRMVAECLGKSSPYQDVVDACFIGNLIMASPLHDVGKVAIPDNILLKPGKLTPEEFVVMKTHTLIGANTLEQVRQKYPASEFIHIAIGVARSHHERWDGLGYPDGLFQEEIPLEARIMALADVYDALRSRRCYKEALSHENSCDLIYEQSGRLFDPVVVDVFRKIELEFAELSRTLND